MNSSPRQDAAVWIGGSTVLAGGSRQCPPRPRAATPRRAAAVLVAALSHPKPRRVRREQHRAADPLRQAVQRVAHELADLGALDLVASKRIRSRVDDDQACAEHDGFALKVMESLRLGHHAGTIERHQQVALADAGHVAHVFQVEEAHPIAALMAACRRCSSPSSSSHRSANTRHRVTSRPHQRVPVAHAVISC